MFKQIVVGTDGSTGANIAVDAAIELARLSGATLHVVNADKLMTRTSWRPPPMSGSHRSTSLDERRDPGRGEAHLRRGRRRAGQAGVQAETHNVGGDPADALMQVATDTGADLLVVGNRGMTGARRFVLGSVPNKVSHHCPASLLIVDTTPDNDSLAAAAAADPRGAQPVAVATDRYESSSARRRSRSRRSASSWTSASACSYASRASSARPRRRNSSPRVEWK